jgi:hypothetical protein
MRAAIPTAPRAYIGRCRRKACRRVRSASRDSCVKRSWWRARANGPACRPRTPTTRTQRCQTSSPGWAMATEPDVAVALRRPRVAAPRESLLSLIASFARAPARVGRDRKRSGDQPLRSVARTRHLRHMIGADTFSPPSVCVPGSPSPLPEEVPCVARVPFCRVSLGR